MNWKENLNNHMSSLNDVTTYHEQNIKYKNIRLIRRTIIIFDFTKCKNIKLENQNMKCSFSENQKPKTKNQKNKKPNFVFSKIK